VFPLKSKIPLLGALKNMIRYHALLPAKGQNALCCGA